MKDIKKNILIVDDEPDVVELLAYNFASRGYAVQEASDGLDAISQVQKLAPDIIISDIMMPNMNGINFCKYIKTSEQYKDIPIIFLSAVEDDYLAMGAINAGGSDYISKPIHMKTLVDKITKHLNNSVA